MKKRRPLKPVVGLPGGANEFGFSTEGYKADSPDRNKPFNLIPSGTITMENVPHDVLGIDNLGNEKLMTPGNNYQFPGNEVFEIPMTQEGGSLPKAQVGLESKATGYTRDSGEGDAKDLSKYLRPIISNTDLGPQVCNEVGGCSEYSSRKLQDLYGTSYDYNKGADDAWFKEAHNLKNGGKSLYNSKQGVISKYSDSFQIGDFVSLNRTGDAPSGSSKESVRGYPSYVSNNDLDDPRSVEHSGIIVGFTEDGEPVVEHSSHGRKEAYRSVLKDDEFVDSPWGMSYNVQSVFRDPQMIDPSEYIKNKDKEFYANKEWDNAPATSINPIKEPHWYGDNQVTEDFDNIYNENREYLGRSLNVAPSELDRLYKTAIGIGFQETDLDGNASIHSGDDLGSHLKYSIKDSVTPAVKLIKDTFSKTVTEKEAIANKKYNLKNGLKPMPHGSLLDKQAILYIKNNPDLVEGLERQDVIDDIIKPQYTGRPEKAYKENTIPSVGAFQAKYASPSAKNKLNISDGRDDRSYLYDDQQSYYGNSTNQLFNAIATLKDLEDGYSKSNPELTPQEIKDYAIIGYNAPGKTRNEDIMDFFYRGVDNPDHEKDNITYLNNVKQYMTQYYKQRGGNVLTKHQTKGEVQTGMSIPFSLNGDYAGGSGDVPPQDGKGYFYTDPNNYDTRIEATFTGGKSNIDPAMMDYYQNTYNYNTNPNSYNAAPTEPQFDFKTQSYILPKAQKGLESKTTGYTRDSVNYTPVQTGVRSVWNPQSETYDAIPIYGETPSSITYDKNTVKESKPRYDHDMGKYVTRTTSNATPVDVTQYQAGGPVDREVFNESFAQVSNSRKPIIKIDRDVEVENEFLPETKVKNFMKGLDQYRGNAKLKKLFETASENPQGFMQTGGANTINAEQANKVNAHQRNIYENKDPMLWSKAYQAGKLITDSVDINGAKGIYEENQYGEFKKLDKKSGDYQEAQNYMDTHDTFEYDRPFSLGQGDAMKTYMDNNPYTNRDLKLAQDWDMSYTRPMPEQQAPVVGVTFEDDRLPRTQSKLDNYQAFDKNKLYENLQKTAYPQRTDLYKAQEGVQITNPYEGMPLGNIDENVTIMNPEELALRDRVKDVPLDRAPIEYIPSESKQPVRTLGERLNHDELPDLGSDIVDENFPEVPVDNNLTMQALQGYESDQVVSDEMLQNVLDSQKSHSLIEPDLKLDKLPKESRKDKRAFKKHVLGKKDIGFIQNTSLENAVENPITHLEELDKLDPKVVEERTYIKPSDTPSEKIIKAKEASPTLDQTKTVVKDATSQDVANTFEKNEILKTAEKLNNAPEDVFFTNPIDIVLQNGTLGLNEQTPSDQDRIKNILNQALPGFVTDSSEVTSGTKAWCAAYAHSILKESGRSDYWKGTSDPYNKLRAKSFLNVGSNVDESPKKGDLMVVWVKGSGYHVAFYAGENPSGNPIMLGGNQSRLKGESSDASSGEVSFKTFDKTSVDRKVVGYRRLNNTADVKQATVANYKTFEDDSASDLKQYSQKPYMLGGSLPKAQRGGSLYPPKPNITSQDDGLQQLHQQSSQGFDYSDPMRIFQQYQQKSQQNNQRSLYPEQPAITSQQNSNTHSITPSSTVHPLMKSQPGIQTLGAQIPEMTSYTQRAPQPNDRLYGDSLDDQMAFDAQAMRNHVSDNGGLNADINFKDVERSNNLQEPMTQEPARRLHKFERGFDGLALAEGVNTGMNFVSSSINDYDATRRERELNKQLTGDMLYNPVGGDASGNRGDYNVNSGLFRNDEHTIGRHGNIMQQGGSVEEDSVYLSQAEIDDILSKGGEIEYLD